MLDILLQNILKKTGGVAVFILNREGQLIKSQGQLPNINLESLAVLVSSNVATTASLAELMQDGTSSFTSISLGERYEMQICSLTSQLIIAVLSGKKAYAGHIRFELEEARLELTKQLDKLNDHGGLSRHTQELMFEDIKDYEIDALFTT